MGDVEWAVWARRSGGYVYVDAWMFSEEYLAEQALINGAPS
jgi:hypothetical protein